MDLESVKNEFRDLIISSDTHYDKYQLEDISTKFAKAISNLQEFFVIPSTPDVSTSALGGGQWQKCPKCDGQGTMSKPPWVAGDVWQWSSTTTAHQCDVCYGQKIIKC